MCAALFGAVAVSNVDNDTNTHEHNHYSDRYSDLLAVSDSSVTVKTVTIPTEEKHSDIKEAEPAQEEAAQDVKEEQSSDVGQAEAAQAETGGNVNVDEPAPSQVYYCPACACTQVDQEQYELMVAELIANGGDGTATDADGNTYCTLCGATLVITEPEEVSEEEPEQDCEDEVTCSVCGSTMVMDENGQYCCPNDDGVSHADNGSDEMYYLSAAANFDFAEATE